MYVNVCTPTACCNPWPRDKFIFNYFLSFNAIVIIAILCVQWRVSTLAVRPFYILNALCIPTYARVYCQPQRDTSSWFKFSTEHGFSIELVSYKQLRFV
jgi:hypothetical protein